jgi:hypothetical protein
VRYVFSSNSKGGRGPGLHREDMETSLDLDLAPVARSLHACAERLETVIGTLSPDMQAAVLFSTGRELLRLRDQLVEAGEKIAGKKIRKGLRT